jgi:hypothetical protein
MPEHGVPTTTAHHGPDGFLDVTVGYQDPVAIAGVSEENRVERGKRT